MDNLPNFQPKTSREVFLKNLSGESIFKTPAIEEMKSEDYWESVMRSLADEKLTYTKL